MPNILVVEDSPPVQNALRQALSRAGHRVMVVGSAAETLNLLQTEKADLIVMDLGLPDMDGLLLCQRLRRDSDVPILVVSARGREVDKVLGLEMGADDYLAKPFSVPELQARVKALLRRAGMGADRDRRLPALLKEGELELDLRSHRASLRGAPLKLKPKEFDLLAFLMQNRGQVFSQQQLLQQVWGYDAALDSRTVVVHVGWLRRQIEEDPARPRFIETVRGVGYRFMD